MRARGSCIYDEGERGGKSKDEGERVKEKISVMLDVSSHYLTNVVCVKGVIHLYW